MNTNIVDIFCIIDDFSKLFDQTFLERSIEHPSTKKKRKRKFRMSDSEIMTILILFHHSRYRDLKSFYLKHICTQCKQDFPDVVSYNRFVELQSRVITKMLAFFDMCCLGECTGISFIGSAPLRACHIKREKGHKTMKGWAKKGKSTMGWLWFQTAHRDQ